MKHTPTRVRSSVRLIDKSAEWKGPEWRRRAAHAGVSIDGLNATDWVIRDGGGDVRVCQCVVVGMQTACIEEMGWGCVCGKWG